MAQVVSLPQMKTSQVSVSGLSSGGYMAVQYEVAFSASTMGAGVIAGGPYYCARGSVNTATNVCSCTASPFLCRVRPGGTNIPELVSTTAQNAASGGIDPTAGLAGHKVWLFSGKADSLVPQDVMNDLETYYRQYLPVANIFYKKDLQAQHTMPTDSYGNNCAKLGSPYISNCGFDAAGELLKWIYGSLNARAAGNAAGTFVEFDQAEFLPDPGTHGMAATGYLYIPPGCAGAGTGCRLHVVFHGCLQDPTNVGDQYIRHAGYNPWADSNRIVLLYPQTAPVYPLANPNACWDWFNYDDPRYAQKDGHQMAAVRRMVERLTGTGGPTPPPPPPPACITASNLDHVRAGRAHDNLFRALANGSNQNMGLDNIFIQTTLKRTGPNFYVIGSCP
ncbi:PHA-depolymerase-like protein [Oxalobacteraceae bacterium]|nr:PHA-depolymerase-like protein [Oxalobacteraceae bacterium]